MPENSDREYAIWVTPDELGKKKEIHPEGSTVTFVVPANIDGHVVLRLKGLGYRNGSRKGDLHVRINLMEEGLNAERSPFSQNRGRFSEGGFGSFSQMWPPQSQERDHRRQGPSLQKEVVNDPMQKRRAGYLIAGSGLVLLFGGYFGILPVSAWAGSIFVVAGIGLAFLPGNAVSP